MSLADQPYWTEADEAELDVLIHELCDVALRHRESCELCVLAGGFCDESKRPLANALQVVLDWRDRRILQSKAAYYRAREEVAA